MPTLSMFFGLIIRMYYAPMEHNPPHIHVYYQDFSATVEIKSGKILQGELPAKQLRILLAWMEIHYDELLGNWTLCQNGEKPYPIKPLK